MICISTYYLSLHNFLNKMSFIACNFLLSRNHVKKMSLQEFVRELMEAKLELKWSKMTILKCLRRCSWSAWVVYHDWKLQIRKEIKEVESEKESDLSTDQYFGHISLLKNAIDTNQMGWYHDLNIYNFSVLSFWKFTIFEG